MTEVLRYGSEMKDLWNDFIDSSVNGTFLFNRNYMDYHSDRFTDHSLVFTDGGKVRALLPATVKDGILKSHGGLTYGGLIVSSEVKTPEVLDMFTSMNSLLRNEGITAVEYKPVPWIYHSLPSESDLYALFKVCKAQLTGRLVSSAVRMDNKLKLSGQRHRGVNKARRNGLIVRETKDIDSFYDILDKNLMARHGVHPVHTIDELHLLMQRFPDRIRLFMTYCNDTPLAGSLLFITKNVVHTQYISASEEGKEMGALDMLFDYLINNCPSECSYFDFGCSTEEGGYYLNEGLIHQKEGFGARGVCYDIYTWNL